MSPRHLREFRYDVELTSSGGRPRTFRYVALTRVTEAPQLLRYHSDWFVAETVQHPASPASLGTIAGVEVADLMRNDMREVIADREQWDAASRSLAMDLTRALRRQLVRWLLVLDDPPLLRIVRDDGTILHDVPLRADTDQPVYRALVTMFPDVG